MRVYDWAAAAKDSWFISDGIHYTSAGYAARAYLIAHALAAAFPAQGGGAPAELPDPLAPDPAGCEHRRAEPFDLRALLEPAEQHRQHDQQYDQAIMVNAARTAVTVSLPKAQLEPAVLNVSQSLRVRPAAGPVQPDR